MLVRLSISLSRLNPEPLINYMNEIKKELNNLKLEKLPEIIEPG